MKLLTFLSDFGLKSSYVSQMKGMALSMTNAGIVDISHEITPQNISEGAFVLMTAIPYFPAGTVHVAVVDPSVGTFRKGIVITTKTQILVGPDNALLIPAARNLGDFTVYEITNPKLTSDFISNTFHGRDIFTPVAAHILNGLLFEQIGPIVKDFINLDFGVAGGGRALMDTLENAYQCLNKPAPLWGPGDAALPQEALRLLVERMLAAAQAGNKAMTQSWLKELKLAADRLGSPQVRAQARLECSRAALLAIDEDAAMHALDECHPPGKKSSCR